MKQVRATRYVTPLREGGSLPGIVEADDLDHTAWWAVPGRHDAVYDILWNKHLLV